VTGLQRNDPIRLSSHITVDAKFVDVFKLTKGEVRIPFSHPISSEFNPAKGLQ
jgi:hypothetical protein